MLVSGEVTIGLECFNGTEGHVVVVAEHNFNLIAIRSKEGFHLVEGLGAIPIGGVFGELVYFDTGISYSLDGILCAEFGILVSRLSLEHDVLHLAIFVLVRFRMCFPILNDNLALHGARLLGLCADIVYFIPSLHIFRKWLAVEEHNRGVLCFCLFDNRGRCGSVHRVDCKSLHFLGKESIHLLVLGGLRVLAVDDLDIGLVFGIVADSITYVGHKGVIKFVNCDTNLWFSTCSTATADEEQSSQRHGDK